MFMPAKRISGRQERRPAKESVVRIMHEKPRVLLADDHTLVTEALAKLFEPEFEVVGRLSDGRALLDLAPKLKPDVVVLDLNMPLLNGMDAGQQLKELLPDAKLVVLTASEDLDFANEAIRTWASAFLLKKSAGSELVKAIHEVLKGKSYVAAGLSVNLAENRTREARPPQTKRLTIRQREVLQLLAEGRTMKEAAKLLGLTARTVAFHKYKMMHEFGIKNNSDLVRFAIKVRVVPPL
jgi:DNA-binding NarL/FixJ family response regulator